MNVGGTKATPYHISRAHARIYLLIHPDFDTVS